MSNVPNLHGTPFRSAVIGVENESGTVLAEPITTVNFDEKIVAWNRAHGFPDYIGPSGSVLQADGSRGMFWADRSGDPAFDPNRTIHCVGDLHVGYTSPDRLDAAERDMRQLNHLFQHRVFMGDTVDSGTSHDATALAYLEGMDARSRWDAVIGNHDLDGRDASAWMSAFGYDALNWTRDLGFAKLIGLNPTFDAKVNTTAPCTLQPDTLAFLATELGNTTTDCIIVTHAPLMNSVVSTPYSSTTIFSSSQPDADIVAILADHPNARSWVSGHTHSKLDSAGLVKMMTYGGTTIVAANVGGIAYLGHGSDMATSLLVSAFITILPGGRIVVRFRDHIVGAWTTIGEFNPTVATLPALSPAPIIPGLTDDAGPA